MDEPIPQDIHRLVSPPLPFATIYRLATALSASAWDLGDISGVQASVVHGPFAVERSVPVRIYGVGSAALTLGTERVAFPSGSHLMLMQWVELGADFAAMASAHAAEFAALLEINFPGILVEREFEGPVNSGTQWAMSSQTGFRIRALRELGPEDLTSALSRDAQRLAALDVGERARFDLMARWWRRGAEAATKTDQFLSFYIALEVYPVAGGRGWPRLVRDFLHQELLPTTDPGQSQMA